MTNINLNIRADVIDITSDTPRSTDTFLVDTNVWIWQTYPNATLNTYRSVARKSQIFSKYLNQVLQAGGQLKYSGLTFAEIAHVIETKEYKIFQRQNRLKDLTLKQYRHNCASERNKVTSTVQSAWSQVTSLASSADITVDEAAASTALNRFRTQALDGYDLFLVEAISRTGLTHIQILTDDMDYACVPDIQLFTSNGLVIQQAKAQRKLCKR